MNIAFATLAALVFTVAAHADWTKTCDSSAQQFQCIETTANFGAPQTCGVGIGTIGHACPRTTDLGFCRRTFVNGNYVIVSDTFLYASPWACDAQATPAQCQAELNENCRTSGEGVWTSGDHT